MIDERMKEECLQLRQEKHLPAWEVSQLTGVHKDTISRWFRGETLTEEQKTKYPDLNWDGKKVYREPESKFYAAYRANVKTKHKTAKVSETAVMFRLAIHGIDYYLSPHDSDIIDFIVSSEESGKTAKIQVRTAICIKKGMSKLSLIRCSGTKVAKRYSKNECDVLVAYDIPTDTAYVYLFDELTEYSSNPSVSREHAERWDKVTALLAP
jgi:hypothetical protein